MEEDSSKRFILFLMVLTLLFAPAFAQITAEDWFFKGNALLDQGKYDEAIQAFNESIRLDPTHAETYINKGNALDNEGKPVNAIQEFDKAIQLRPDNPDTHNNKGVALNRLGKYDEAIQEFNEAIQLRPDYAKAHNNKGVALNGLGKYDEAIQEFNEAIQLKPNFSEAYYGKGFAFNSSGKYDEAIQSYDKAILIKPDYFDAYYNKGTVFCRLGKYDEATKAFTKAMQLRPDKWAITVRSFSKATPSNILPGMNAPSQYRGNLGIYVFAGKNVASHAAVALQGPNDSNATLKGYTFPNGYFLISNLECEYYYLIIDWRDRDGNLWRNTSVKAISPGSTRLINVNLSKCNSTNVCGACISPWV